MSVQDISVEVAKKVTAIGVEMRSRAVRAGRALENAATENVLKGQGSGRIYKRKNMSTFHQASAPGQPPVPDTDALRSSFRSVENSVSSGGLSIRIAIETDKHYAGYLEHGTSKMAARPYVEKIKQQAEPEITAIFSAPYNV